jgi:hypothetical protein
MVSGRHPKWPSEDVDRCSYPHNSREKHYSTPRGDAKERLVSMLHNFRLSATSCQFRPKAGCDPDGTAMMWPYLNRHDHPGPSMNPVAGELLPFVQTEVAHYPGVWNRLGILHWRCSVAYTSGDRTGKGYGRKVPKLVSSQVASAGGGGTHAVWCLASNTAAWAEPGSVSGLQACFAV